MSNILAYLLIYSIVILILILVYRLATAFIKYFFKSKDNEKVNFGQPITKVLLALIAANAGRDEIAVPVINAIIQFLKEKTTIHIDLVKASDTNSSITEKIILNVSILLGLILYTVVVYSRKKITIIEKEINAKGEKITSKINFPPDSQPVSPIFYERIKLLFELKYGKGNLYLTYDSVFSSLYGTYKSGLHTFYQIVFCHATVAPVSISDAEIAYALNTIEKIKSHYMTKEPNLIFEYYYLLEKGNFLNELSNSIVCLTENSLLNQLIDFENYLQKTIGKFYNEKLPFSNSDQNENKLSLQQTFISPHFTVSNNTIGIELEEYINIWLSQDSRKHLVILGDYGMGKSTFMKYYACYAAKKIIETKEIIRYPVFISLTNMSPIHGGIDNAIGRFVSDNLGVDRKLFDCLVNAGKIVFLLDGFDEMGYVGTHNQRIKQLNAIWKLATKNNKIIISGRPSYFPTEEELNISFNIKEEQQFTPQEIPYFEKIEIEGFDKDQIVKSIELYGYTGIEVTTYKNFIFHNPNFYDLCRRPSMMHIIREMLPKLYSEHSANTLNTSKLMNEYINYWIDRQISKGIIGVIEEDSKKRQIIIDIFSDLAREFYIKGVEKQNSVEIIKTIKPRINALNLLDQNEIDGFETEILSGFFIEIDNNEYSFVHKSFKEYFVSKKIKILVNDGKVSDELIISKLWTKEIVDYVFEDNYPNDTQPLLGREGYPFLLDLLNVQDRNKRIFKYIYINFYNSSKSVLDILKMKFNMRLANYPLLYIDLIRLSALFFISELHADLRDIYPKPEKFKIFYIIRIMEKSYYYSFLRDKSILNEKTEFIKSIISKFDNIDQNKKDNIHEIIQ